MLMMTLYLIHLVTSRFVSNLCFAVSSDTHDTRTIISTACSEQFRLLCHCFVADAFARFVMTKFVAMTHFTHDGNVP